MQRTLKKVEPQLHQPLKQKPRAYATWSAHVSFVGAACTRLQGLGSREVTGLYGAAAEASRSQ